MALDLAPIQARLEAITREPWEVAEACSYENGKRVDVELFVRRPEDDVSVAAQILDPETSKPSQANADFIANAPANVRALLAEVAELRAALIEHRRDLHQGSGRPCPTCRQSAKALGKGAPGGCWGEPS